jgi:shikimate kinase
MRRVSSDVRGPATRPHPSLNNPDPRGTLARLLAQRAPLYEEVAEFVVDTDGRKVRTVVDQICHRLGVLPTSAE